jgi:hypothetical protein
MKGISIVLVMISLLIPFDSFAKGSSGGGHFTDLD